MPPFHGIIGGLADGGKYRNCTGGAAGYIDLKVVPLLVRGNLILMKIMLALFPLVVLRFLMGLGVWFKSHLSVSYLS